MESSTNLPNILFVLTDDLDYASAQKMPQIRSRLVDEGASFEEAFVSLPQCCPSRATILTGLFAHNHKVTGNNPPEGGWEKFVSEGHEEHTIAARPPALILGYGRIAQPAIEAGVRELAAAIG